MKILKFCFLLSFNTVILLANSTIEFKSNEGIDLNNQLNIKDNVKYNISYDIMKYDSFEIDFNKNLLNSCNIENNKLLCNKKSDIDLVLDINTKDLVTSKKIKLINIDAKEQTKDLLYNDLILRNSELSENYLKLNKEKNILNEENIVLKRKIENFIEINNQIVQLEKEKNELYKENELLKKRTEHLLSELNNKCLNKKEEIIEKKIIEKKIIDNRKVEIKIKNKKIIEKNKNINVNEKELKKILEFNLN